LDKDLVGLQSNPVDYVSYGLIGYTVPSGKTFYVAEIAAHARPTDLQDNLQALVEIRLYRYVNATPYYVYFGAGVGGVYVSFSKPKKFSSGEGLSLAACQFSGQTMHSLWGHVGGWEE